MIEPETFKPVAGGPFIDLAMQLNKLRRFAISIRPRPGRNTHIQETSNGIMIDASPAGAAATPAEGVLKQYLVTAVAPDYLTCTEYPGGTEAVYIAKPHEFRSSVWHGQEIQFTHEFTGSQFRLSFQHSGTSGRIARLSTGAGVFIVSENQAIIPRYIPNSTVIYAMESEQAIGITTAPSIVTKVDINSGGRAWVRLLS